MQLRRNASFILIVPPVVASLLESSTNGLKDSEVRAFVAARFQPQDYRRRRVILIVPDATRTAPIGVIFKALHAAIGRECAAFNVLIALGTHPPMTEEAICARLEITAAQRSAEYSAVRFFNHEWANREALRNVGCISADEIWDLSGGLFEMEVCVNVNARVFDYDEIIIIGPVFPHEVVGFSGGNKYLFPGISGPEILNFFHWLGAVVTNPMIIGNKWTPVRRVVDRAAAFVDVPKRCLALVVDGGRLAGLFEGAPEAAWDKASDLSRERHIILKAHPYHTVLSCAPTMYDELWVGGKCMYKLEPVVADGGELIIFAPHIREISLTHGRLIREIGYHCRDYFLHQWDRFKDYPWGVLAHSTHVRGIGTFEDGIENCRIAVTLATGISKEDCEAVNLGWRDPSSINPRNFLNREDEGVLCVPKAGETLYHLQQRPVWAKEM